MAVPAAGDYAAAPVPIARQGVFRVKKTAAAALVCAMGLVGVAAPAGAAKGGAKPAQETATLTIDAATGSGTVTAAGAFAGSGTVDTLKGKLAGRTHHAVEKLTFGTDTVTIKAVAVRVSRTVDSSTCAVTEKDKGVWKIVSGTGAFAKAKGHGHFVANGQTGYGSKERFVKVFCAGDLDAGEQLVLVPHAAPTVTRVNVIHAVAWESGTLVFDNEPLSSVVRRVARYGRHPIVIADEQTSKLRISGVFHEGDVAAFVSTVVSYLSVRAEQQEDGSVRLSSRASPGTG